jgi:hypothetical protein
MTIIGFLFISSIKKQKTKRNKGKNQWCAENLNIHYKMEKTASK